MRSFVGRAALVCVSVVAIAEGKLYVTGPASVLVEQGVAAPAPSGAAAAEFVRVPAPSVSMRNNEAQATTAPWIEANGWRFERGLKKANYDKLPAGAAVSAAAEAFVYDVDAILNPDPADLPELTRFFQFLKQQQRDPLPVMANIGVVDDHSPAMEEILNMLTRRNLLYRMVSAPDRRLDLTVQLGNKDFPVQWAQDPSDFAARVREKLGDDRRLIRLYGTSTVIAHLTGNSKQARLYLLSYTRGSGRGQGWGEGGPSIRIRLLGQYEPVKFAGFGTVEGARLMDVEHRGNSTEFSVPAFKTLGIIDLESNK